MAKTSTLVVVISTTGGAGFSHVVDMELRGAELMVREDVKGCEVGAVKVQDLGMALLEAAQGRLPGIPGIPMAVTLAAETQVLRLVRPAVKDFMMTIGVLALATIRGDLGSATVQTSVGVTIIMVVVGDTRTVLVLPRMEEWQEEVLTLNCSNRRCMMW
jgi:hypothetical protein